MTATRRSAGRSHLMHGALELLADGVAPRVAAERAGVTLQALYRAMRSEGIGTRCPTCGKLDTRANGRDREPLDAGNSDAGGANSGDSSD